MKESREYLYAAFKAKDARFDGRFFIGISSTGIYCRPVCRAKQPKAENCTFYSTAAEAEQAGYRPCLLCRPELAPGNSITDASSNLAFQAMRLIEEHCGTGQGLPEIVEKLGCTDRHLRRVFSAEFNVSPLQYMQTCRLLLAKSLLTDTKLSVLDVAMSAGFGSLRRFNDLFKKHYHLSPTALRKRVAKGKSRDDQIVLSLGYRPPYRWDEMLAFFAGRAIPGVETVRDGHYFRTVHLTAHRGKDMHGWLKVGHHPGKNALRVAISENLLPVLPQILTRVRYMFDLYCDPHAVHESLSSMNEIRPGLCILGTRLPGCFNHFEMAVRAVLGQQITVKAAGTLAARLVSKYGKPVQTEIEGLTHLFPSARDILALEDIEDCLGSLGITSARSRTIRELARALVHQKIDLDFCAKPEEEMKKLMEIRGIGSWTARYIAMRAMKWPDSFLETDAGVQKALETYDSRALLKMSEKWRPWRSYATVSLWNTL